MSVYRKLNSLRIDDLDHPIVVSKFLYAVQDVRRRGFTSVNLNFSNITSVFPNAAVPIAGLIEYFRNEGLEIKRSDSSNIIATTHLLDPIEPQKLEDITTRNVLNKIWRFSSSEQVFWLVDSFLNELPKVDQFEQGVLNGLEWCINEVMDNVIQHSGEDCGFVMGQMHKSTKHVAFTVFDYGRGIYNSLKVSTHRPRFPVDALTLCIKEGVTRDKKIGQGNGMYGLHQIVKFNEGRLTITSNNASYFLRKNKAETYTKIPSISREKGCTTIDFQLDYGNEVSISDALKFNGKSYELINIRVENLENAFGEIVYDLKNKANGYGTRQSGERVRNDILNISREVNKIIVIDFEGISVISSSFADELIGKLVIEFGFFGFNNIIRLKNMNTLIQSIVQRSVGQRMAESLSENS
jgi:STAS-like domain of unknown function (DUF4325)